MWFPTDPRNEKDMKKVILEARKLMEPQKFHLFSM